MRITGRFEPEPEMVKHVNDYAKDLMKKMEEVVGFSEVELEARFEKLRVEETNVANFIADIIRVENPTCDLAMIITGTLRTNAVIPAGDLKLKFIADLLSLPDKIVLKSIPGSVLREALENSVSFLPKLDGRLCCISGCTFTYDITQAVGKRVKEVFVNGMALKEQQTYTVAMKEYMAVGKIGFECFKDMPCLTNIDEARDLCELVVSFMRQLGVGESEERAKKLSQICNIDVYNKSQDGFVKISPTVEGRIK